MRVRLVVRLLSASQSLLAWGEVWAEARGDQALWPLGPLRTVGEADGTAVLLSVHWPDLHVHYVRPVVPALVIRDRQVVMLAFGPEPLVRFATDASVPLVPVTVRGPVNADMPLGALGVRQ